jgi:hypothetical protein
MGKKMERVKRKGKPSATMKGPYLWVFKKKLHIYKSSSSNFVGFLHISR